jgi:hypothetical protein
MSKDSPPFLPFYDRLKWAGKEVLNILLTADITFACVMLGLLMMLWSAFGMFKTTDIAWFANGFAFEWSPWLWAMNHSLVGYGFIHCAIHKFPSGRSLMLGTYCCCIFTLIAVGRPAASFSSGMTLNICVIVMGALLTHRSGRDRAA